MPIVETRKDKLDLRLTPSSKRKLAQPPAKQAPAGAGRIRARVKRTSASRSFSEHTRSKRFLVRFALQNRQANASRTYVAVSSDEIAGLARLAMAAPGKGQVLVSGPLKDAMLRTLRAADIAGLRDFAVHAKDGDAGAFYERFDLRAAMRKRS